MIYHGKKNDSQETINQYLKEIGCPLPSVGEGEIMRNLATDMAVELKKVIASLEEKLDNKKYRAFSLQLNLITREYGDDFSAAGINGLSVLSDLYYMEGHDEQIKEILTTIDGVLDTYVMYQNASDQLSNILSEIIHSDDYIDQHDLARSMCPVDQHDDDDEW